MASSKILSVLLNHQGQDRDHPYTLIIGIFLIFIIALVARLRNPLNSIPGPFWARWTPFWLAYYASNGNMHQKMIETHKTYGSLVRTGPNEISVSNPQALKVIYGQYILSVVVVPTAKPYLRIMLIFFCELSRRWKQLPQKRLV